MNINERFDVSPGKVEALLERLRRLKIDPALIEEGFSRGGGKGGQKINKTSNRVQLHYPPLGISVSCQRERKRSVNRFLALRELVDRVEMLVSPDTSERLKETERLRKRKSRRAERAGKKYGGAQASPATDLPIGEGFSISEIEPSDKPALLEHLQEKEIYDQTLAIPYPYTQADADAWLAKVAEETRKQGRCVNWVIREPGGGLIGGIGFHNLEVGKSREAEIGYWLAKPFWSRGIMTRAVRRAVELGFAELGLERVTAHVFPSNRGSMRVLEKAGFRFEGLREAHYRKDGKLLDGKRFVLDKPAGPPER